MQNAPSAEELVAAVKSFLEEHAMPALEGRNAFHARVAANALAIVERELADGPKAAEEERERLMALLGEEASLAEMNADLATRIRSGEINAETPGLVAHLLQTTKDKVSIDQPSYSGLKTAKQSDE